MSDEAASDLLPNMTREMRAGLGTVNSTRRQVVSMQATRRAAWVLAGHRPTA
jgi:hypothetical protein